MNTDIATKLVSASAARTQNSVQIAVLKKSHEMQSELINTLMQSALSAPPPAKPVVSAPNVKSTTT